MRDQPSLHITPIGGKWKSWGLAQVVERLPSEVRAAYSMSMSTTVSEFREASAAGKRPFLVDVRSGGEFGAEHIPGAVHIPLEEIEARVDDIPAEGPVVLVCHSGDRSAMARELILPQRPQAETLEGGTEAWKEAGLPLVCSRRTRWSLERQVRLTAGSLILLGTILSLTVAPAWVFLAMFVGGGLVFAGITNVCGMASLFAAMPWNKPKAAPSVAEPAQTL
jgi:rhodanese-related sulfurtransferase